MILSFRTDRSGQTVQTQISLIKIYTVCNSFCIFWTHCSTVNRPCSNFRVITANFLGFLQYIVGILRRLLRIFLVSRFLGFLQQHGQSTDVPNWNGWLCKLFSNQASLSQNFVQLVLYPHYADPRCLWKKKGEYEYLKELKRRSIKPGFHVMFSIYVFTAHKENIPWKLKNLCGICSFSLRFIQSEDRSWRLIAFADSTGAWEYT